MFKKYSCEGCVNDEIEPLSSFRTYDEFSEAVHAKVKICSVCKRCYKRKYRKEYEDLYTRQ